MGIFKKKYLFQDGDTIEIHINQNGFDNFFLGKLEGMDQTGIFIRNDHGHFFIPIHQVLYFKKVDEK